MAVSPYDRRKKTRRAHMDDIRQVATDRFKTANRVARKMGNVPAAPQARKSIMEGPPTEQKFAPSTTKKRQYSEALTKLAREMAKPGPGANRKLPDTPSILRPRATPRRRGMRQRRG